MDTLLSNISPLSDSAKPKRGRPKGSKNKAKGLAQIYATKPKPRKLTKPAGAVKRTRRSSTNPVVSSNPASYSSPEENWEKRYSDLKKSVYAFWNLLDIECVDLKFDNTWLLTAKVKSGFAAQRFSEKSCPVIKMERILFDPSEIK